MSILSFSIPHDGHPGEVRRLEALARVANAGGLHARLGPGSLHVRSAAEWPTKGDAIRLHLGVLRDRGVQIDNVMFAGNDDDDAAGFDAVSELVARGELAYGCNVAIGFPPPARLRPGSTITMDNAHSFSVLLRYLAAGGG